MFAQPGVPLPAVFEGAHIIECDYGIVAPEAMALMIMETVRDMNQKLEEKPRG